MPLGMIFCLKVSRRAECGAQDFTPWTLLGEYTGVWDSQEKVAKRISEDPTGLGVMRRDKVAALAYTSEEALLETRKGVPRSSTAFVGTFLRKPVFD